MQDRELKTTVENKSHLLQQALERETEAPGAQGTLSPQRDPLAQVTCRLGDVSCAGAHASTLNRATAGLPSRAGHSLLQLQRQYGNRYVQRVLSLARKGEGEAEVAPEVEQAIQRARGGGQALDSGTRARIESAFGADFSGVRVHADAEADTLNRALNARAFTTGQDIFFRQGAYNPGSSSGRQLMAHELIHVVQQAGGACPKLTVGQQGDRYEQEADRVARVITQQLHPRVHTREDEGLVHRQVGEEVERPIVAKSQVAWVQRDTPGTEGVTTEEFDLAEQKRDHHRLVDDWHQRYLRNLDRNAGNARNANQRFIEFEEDAINELRTVGSLGGSVVALFGGPAAVLGLCITVLTEVAAQNLSGESAKIAAAVARLDEKLTSAKTETDNRRDSLRNQIDSMTSAYSRSEWVPLWNTIANFGVPEITLENIIYRDLLLEFARQGGYNISGSQWNVDNRGVFGIFGKGDWYHSSDWGSPGWTNGEDVADALNALAKGDPSTLIRVSIN